MIPNEGYEDFGLGMENLWSILDMKKHEGPALVNVYIDTSI